MSFGTNTDPSLLPPEKIQTFVRVFSKLPYDVLWKWNEDELPGRSKNIRIGKWFPQSDLLSKLIVKNVSTVAFLFVSNACDSDFNKIDASDLTDTDSFARRVSGPKKSYIL